MKLSLCNEVVRDLPFAEQCAFAASVGYQGLEIAPFTLCDAPATLDSPAVADLRKAMQAEGVVCSSLHWLFPDRQDVARPAAGVPSGNWRK